MKEVTITVSINDDDDLRVWDAVNHALRDLRGEMPIKWYWHHMPDHVFDYTDIEE